ncbi:phage holin family protein [Evansella sp. AB-rgal1]|uniref:phage holin family protein n=1 Tax=Evansella sp. AB-rgal1 TaxID=3242696 RepID=UPI00359E503F
MGLLEYIKDGVLYLIPALLILGRILKATPYIEDWLIPYILLGIGIGLSTWILGFKAESIVQGILVTGASVYGYQLMKQANKRNK